MSILVLNISIRLSCFREGNYTQVRIAAFDGLFMSKQWYTPAVVRYILAVMANDPCRTVRRHVARCVCQSLALLVTMGEMKNSMKDSESLLIEEDGSVPEKAKENKKSDVDFMIKVLRKDREIGKNEVLREFMMPIALCVAFHLLLTSCSCRPGLLMSIMRYDGASLSLPILFSGALRKLHPKSRYISLRRQCWNSHLQSSSHPR